jgi:hypothetical protein
MTISKSARGKVVSVLGAIILGIVVNIVWEGLIRLTSLHFPHLHVEAVAVARFVGYVTSALIGVFLGRELERQSIPLPLLRPKIQQSRIFVLEVAGTQPLDSKNSDWKFFLTNCSTRILRRVELYNLKSEIGAYILGFQEIPVMQPGQRIELRHTVFPQRLYGPRTATLWDFAQDVAGARASTFFWYEIYVEYREADDDSTHDGGFVAVCFDLHDKIIKTEGAEYYRNTRLG